MESEGMRLKSNLDTSHDCLILGKSFGLSEPQFPHLQAILRGLREQMVAELRECLIKPSELNENFRNQGILTWGPWASQKHGNEV